MDLRFDFSYTIRRFAVFGLIFNMLVNEHSDFLALVSLTVVYVIGILGMLSVTPSGLDTIAASKISLRFFGCHTYLHVDIYIFMLFIHLCSKEDLVNDDWSIPIVFI